MEEYSKGTKLVTKTCQPFISSNCIICQKQTKLKTSSTLNGRLQLMLAAEKIKDEIYERISIADGDFCYHMDNKCYKGYTLKANRTKSDETVEKEVGSLEESVEPKLKKRRLDIVVKYNIFLIQYIINNLI